jgi:hypothetical protein
MRLLSKDREQRPQTATEVAGIIADIEQQLAAAEAEKIRQKQLADTIELDESPVPVTSPKSHKPRFMAGVVVALAVIGIFGMWYSGIFLKVDTSAGTIIVEIDQPELAGAVVSVDGKRKITITTGEGKEPIEIVADEKMHTLRVTKGGFETFTKQFTVKAGGKQAIKVRLVPLGKIVPTDTPMTDREVAEWVLGIGGKLRTVMK